MKAPLFVRGGALSFAVVGALCGQAAVAQSATGESWPPDLAAVYDAAAVSDPTLAAARLALEAAEQKLPEARAGLMPVVGLSGSVNSTQATSTFSGLPPLQRSGGNSAWTLQLVQPLFRADNLLADQQAPYIVESVQAQFEQARQELVLRVAAGYFAVNEAQDALAAADAEVAAMTRQLDEVSHGFDAGIRAISEVDDTRARLASARAGQIAARNDAETAGADLTALTGAPWPRLARLRDDAILPAPRPDDVGEWMAQARIDQPQVRAQAAAVRVGDFDVERARAGHLPTVDFVATSGRSFSGHSLTTPEDYSTKSVQHVIGVQFNLPLFAGGAIVARVTQAELSAQKARADLESARRSAASDAQHAFAGVVNGLAQVDALQVGTTSSANALKGNLAGFRVGYRTNADVLSAEQQLQVTQRDLSKARYDVLLQGMKLKAAAGILSRADLAAIDALLD